MIKSLEAFISACDKQDNDRIYEIFESEIDENTYVHVMSHVDNDEDPEPVRNALNNLGRQHGIQSLVDY
jgi:hypothetical protein